MGLSGSVSGAFLTELKLLLWMTSKLGGKRKWLHKVLNANEYPKRFMSRAASPAQSSNGTEQDWEPKITITITYVVGLREETRRICDTFDIRVAFMTVRTIHSELIRVKDPLPLEKQYMVVYCVPCACGQAYIGKTIRWLESRMKEHKMPTSEGS